MNTKAIVSVIFYREITDTGKKLNFVVPMLTACASAHNPVEFERLCVLGLICEITLFLAFS